MRQGGEGIRRFRELTPFEPGLCREDRDTGDKRREIKCLMIGLQYQRPHDRNILRRALEPIRPQERSVVVPEDRAFGIRPPQRPDHRATQVFKTFAVAEQPHTEFAFERRFTQLRLRGQRREQVAISPQSDLATGRVGVPNRHCDNQCIQES
jgi:hypothetical protein